MGSGDGEGWAARTDWEGCGWFIGEGVFGRGCEGTGLKWAPVVRRGRRAPHPSFSHCLRPVLFVDEIFDGRRGVCVLPDKGLVSVAHKRGVATPDGQRCFRVVRIGNLGSELL